MGPSKKEGDQVVPHYPLIHVENATAIQSKMHLKCGMEVTIQQLLWKIQCHWNLSVYTVQWLFVQVRRRVFTCITKYISLNRWCTFIQNCAPHQFAARALKRPDTQVQAGRVWTPGEQNMSTMWKQRSAESTQQRVTKIYKKWPITIKLPKRWTVTMQRASPAASSLSWSAVGTSFLSRNPSWSFIIQLKSALKKFPLVIRQLLLEFYRCTWL